MTAAYPGVVIGAAGEANTQILELRSRMTAAYPGVVIGAAGEANTQILELRSE